MKIYLAHPISGLGYDEVAHYYDKTRKALQALGYMVFSPMTGKAYLRTEKKFRAHGYDHPLATNHAIVARDFWMVRICNIIYTNLMYAIEPSIGCISEIAWAYAHRKNIVIAKPIDGDPHHHAFILEMASVVWNSHEAAMTYFEKLISGDQ